MTAPSKRARGICCSCRGEFAWILERDQHLLLCFGHSLKSITVEKECISHPEEFFPSGADRCAASHNSEVTTCNTPTWKEMSNNCMMALIEFSKFYTLDHNGFSDTMSVSHLMPAHLDTFLMLSFHKLVNQLLIIQSSPNHLYHYTHHSVQCVHWLKHLANFIAWFGHRGGGGGGRRNGLVELSTITLFSVIILIELSNYIA